LHWDFSGSKFKGLALRCNRNRRFLVIFLWRRVCRDGCSARPQAFARNTLAAQGLAEELPEGAPVPQIRAEGGLLIRFFWACLYRIFFRGGRTGTALFYTFPAKSHSTWGEPAFCGHFGPGRGWLSFPRCPRDGRIRGGFSSRAGRIGWGGPPANSGANCLRLVEGRI